MAKNKTVPTTVNADAFLEKLKDKEQREDCRTLSTMLTAITKKEAVMWGPAIVGFGMFHYVYDSGREGDMVLIGFSPRKANIALYLMGGMKVVGTELEQLGKHKTGGGCLYIKRLADVKLPVLKKLLTLAYKENLRTKG